MSSNAQSTLTVDLSGSVWLCCLDGNNGKRAWRIRKVIDIPAEPASARDLPPVLKGYGAVPPFVTGISLSVDDRMLYVSCWGTGELRRGERFLPLRLTEPRQLPESRRQHREGEESRDEEPDDQRGGHEPELKPARVATTGGVRGDFRESRQHRRRHD